MIAGMIGSDARDIQVGMQLAGAEAAWLDSAFLNFSNWHRALEFVR